MEYNFEIKLYAPGSKEIAKVTSNYLYEGADTGFFQGGGGWTPAICV